MICRLAHATSKNEVLVKGHSRGSMAPTGVFDIGDQCCFVEL